MKRTYELTILTDPSIGKSQIALNRRFGYLHMALARAVQLLSEPEFESCKTAVIINTDPAHHCTTIQRDSAHPRLLRITHWSLKCNSTNFSVSTQSVTQSSSARSTARQSTSSTAHPMSIPISSRKH
jgi:hypothetical protein